jgi:hypothetical protein
MTPNAHISAELPCHRCGYDLRAHPSDGKCPECGASVAEAIRVAAVPRRPAWRDSDPRWRRRLLAGVWVLVFLPLMELLRASGWASSIPVPNVIGFPGAVRTLDETYLYSLSLYPPLAFCVGVVLLFSKERRRRPAPLDWTRRWGVACSYIVLLLSVVQVLFISALVLVGISAVFLSMPPKYQPGVTQLFVNVSWFYLRYGPDPKDSSVAVLVAFSSITVLLACVPLFDALRSTRLKRYAGIFLAPLALFAVLHLGQVGLYCVGLSGGPTAAVFRYGNYFWPDVLLRYITGAPTGLNIIGSVPIAFFVEAAKWCIVLVIAVWLSVAQLAAWRGRKRNHQVE